MYSKLEKLFLVIIALVITGFACGRPQPQLSSMPEPSTKFDLVPEVRITLSPLIRVDQPLVFHWKIVNNGPHPIYIYSTLLEHPFSADLFIDSAQHVIEVRWLQLQPIPVGVYAFPEASFLEVSSGESREGDFMSDVPTKELVTYKAVESTIEKQKITPGNWKIQVLVAYGNEIDSVKKDIADSLRRGKEHPINPIVRWQKIVYSEPVNVTFEK
jgi:hypothetical protein